MSSLRKSSDFELIDTNIRPFFVIINLINGSTYEQNLAFRLLTQIISNHLLSYRQLFYRPAVSNFYRNRLKDKLNSQSDSDQIDAIETVMNILAIDNTRIIDDIINNTEIVNGTIKLIEKLISAENPDLRSQAIDHITEVLKSQKEFMIIDLIKNERILAVFLSSTNELLTDSNVKDQFEIFKEAYWPLLKNYNKNRSDLTAQMHSDDAVQILRTGIKSMSQLENQRERINFIDELRSDLLSALDTELIRSGFEDSFFKNSFNANRPNYADHLSSLLLVNDEQINGLLFDGEDLSHISSLKDLINNDTYTYHAEEYNAYLLDNYLLYMLQSGSNQIANLLTLPRAVAILRDEFNESINSEDKGYHLNALKRIAAPITKINLEELADAIIKPQANKISGLLNKQEIREGLSPEIIQMLNTCIQRHLDVRNEKFHNANRGYTTINHGPLQNMKTTINQYPESGSQEKRSETKRGNPEDTQKEHSRKRLKLNNS